MGAKPHKFPCPFGPYILQKHIGDGGMAEVFLATRAGHGSFEKTVVIKRLHPFLGRSSKIVKMFEAEARLAGQIEHRNIVHTFDFGALPTGEIYIAMEYVRGVDLRRLLSRSITHKVRLPIWFSVYIVVELLEALAYIHALKDASGRPRNVIHRDLTPSNIFLSEHGYTKLGDFGVAHDEARTNYTRTGALKGKLAYMPPEQLRGEKLDMRTDLFAVGVVLWECLTQRRLFGGRAELDTMNLICTSGRKPPSDHNPEVSQALDRIVLRALSIDREARFESAVHFQRALLRELQAQKRAVCGADVREVVKIISGERPNDGALGTQVLSKVPSEPAYAHEDTAEATRSDPAPVAESTWTQEDESSNASTTPAVHYRSESEMGLDLPIAEPYPTARSSASVSALGIGRLSDLAPATESLSPSESQSPPESPFPTQSPPTPTSKSPSATKSPRASDSGPDYEALVHQAVQEAHVLATAPAPIPETSLLHALEGREEAADSWIAEALAGASQNPESPFWVQDEKAQLFGPCDWHQLLEVAKQEKRKGETLLLSADRSEWIDVVTLAKLIEADLLFAREPLTPSQARGAFQGELEDRSLTSVIGGLIQSEVNGYLGVITPQEKQFALHIKETAPIDVQTDEASLQLFELAVENRLISREMLPSLMHEVVDAQRPLLDAISRRSGASMGGYRSVFMRRRLVEMFRVSTGRFFFVPEDPRALKRVPFARSLWSVLPELVHRAFDPAELRVQLHAMLDAKIARSERFDAAVAKMELSEEQSALVELMVDGKRLSSLCKRFPKDERSLLCLAYLFSETGLFLAP